MLVITGQISGMLLNQFIFQDVPDKDGFSQCFKNVVFTTNRIGVEAYNHVYTDKYMFPAWLQKLVWTFQSLISTTTDVYNLDIRFKYGDLMLSRDEFQGIYYNLAKLLTAAMVHSILMRRMSVDDLIGAVWQVQQMQYRVGFGEVNDSGSGFANIFIPGSILIVGDTIIAMNERNTYSFVGNFALSLNELFNQENLKKDDSKGDQIDYEFYWFRFIQFGLAQFMFVAIFAKIVHLYNKQITDLDLREFLAMPWYNLIFAFWNITLGIGISPIPVTSRDKMFYFCQLFIMCKIGVMFTGAYSDLIQLYIPQNKQIVTYMILFSILFQMFLMDQTATFEVLSAPTFDSIMNKIADAIYYGFDLASTIGNGDIMPGNDSKWILSIPQFQIWQQILGQQYSFSNIQQDQFTSQVIYKSLGLKDEQFYIDDKTQQETLQQHENDSNYKSKKIINGKGRGNEKFMDKIRTMQKKKVSDEKHDNNNQDNNEQEFQKNKSEDKIINGKGSGNQKLMDKINNLLVLNKNKESNKINDNINEKKSERKSESKSESKNESKSESTNLLQHGKIGGSLKFINQMTGEYDINSKYKEEFIKSNKINEKDNLKKSESKSESTNLIEHGKIGGNYNFIKNKIADVMKQ